ncbi:hypothetical protein WA158_002963 [Blastocystis sp. Blastoise]
MFVPIIRGVSRIAIQTKPVYSRSFYTALRASQQSSLLRANESNNKMLVQKRFFMGRILRLGMQLFGSTFSATIRAFVSAFQQQAAKGEDAVDAPTPSMSLKRTVPIPEALQIVNLKREECTRDKLTQVYEKMFSSNDPKDGGSFYLQSKIYRANEVLLKELDEYGYIRDPNAAPSKVQTTTTNKNEEEKE